MVNQERLKMKKNQKIALEAKAGTGKEKKNGELSLRGELTIDNAVQLKQFLAEKLASFETMSVSISKVSSIDLAAIQLLYGFQQEAIRQKKTVSFEFNLSEDDRILLQRSGFEQFIK